MAISGNRQINGSYGSLWLDNEKVAEILSFEAKVTAERKNVLQAGSNDVDSKIINIKGAGRMRLKKVYTRGINALLDAWKEGKDPRSMISAKVDDPDAFGSERVEISDVWFTEITAMQFEVGQLLEREIPFGFTPSSIKMTETIDAK